ncbi:MAG: hypothetical protein RMX35_32595, partial [Nostoc sp. DcaGUA01]|nr:hypothetical protein [Nostoc sp. DcaGUA01]
LSQAYWNKTGSDLCVHRSSDTERGWGEVYRTDVKKDVTALRLYIVFHQMSKGDALTMQVVVTHTR